MWEKIKNHEKQHARFIFLTLIDFVFIFLPFFFFPSFFLSLFIITTFRFVPFYSIFQCCVLSSIHIRWRWHKWIDKIVVGKRKFDGGHQNPGDPKRRYASGLILGNGGNNWGSQPLPQQPLGANGEQWYTDTYAAWS